MSWIWIGLAALAVISFAVASVLGFLFGRANGNDTRRRKR